jgi:hypothetical protein
VGGAGAFPARALHDEDVGAAGEVDERVADLAVAGVGEHAADQVDAEAEAGEAVGVGDPTRLEREAGDLTTEPILYLHEPQLVRALAVDERRVAGLEDGAQARLGARRADDGEVARSGCDVVVLQEDERQAVEVVAVEVADEDGVDAVKRGAGPLEVGEDGGGGVEEVAFVEEEAAPVAAVGEGVAGAQEEQIERRGHGRDGSTSYARR